MVGQEIVCKCLLVPWALPTGLFSSVCGFSHQNSVSVLVNLVRICSLWGWWGTSGFWGMSWLWWEGNHQSHIKKNKKNLSCKNYNIDNLWEELLHFKTPLNCWKDSDLCCLICCAALLLDNYISAVWLQISISMLMFALNVFGPAEEKAGWLSRHWQLCP